MLILAVFAHGATINRHRWPALVVAIAIGLFWALSGVESRQIEVAAYDVSVFAKPSQRREQTTIVLPSWDRELYEAENEALFREVTRQLALGLGPLELSSPGTAERLFLVRTP